ncbi:hypothetical protein HA052_04440 [Chromobacterium haemolyticum]|uniref:Uncharacterized protein n=1 Tax=Chromobacterium fluminis TaxID=3044269 RepID=A0ABX0L4N3_9NEIS|nr:hypothetical protein [Chromobacterium haemolyticum]NHR04439.1 hypothetical protein [Chromobacterium haemolyticum]
MPNTHYPIWFVTVNLEEQVHVQALGFTKQIYLFACSQDAHGAAVVSTRWAESQGMKPFHVDVKDCLLAVSQDVSTYTFPEQIINLPSEVLFAEFDRRKYPESLRVPARVVMI